jgi:purine-binding chemotaxis protein CheW
MQTNVSGAEAVSTDDIRQFTTFHVENLYFGVDVLKVQEVMRHQGMTGVPLAPAVVKGLINLRGQIVTAIDMRCRLGLPPRDPGCQLTNIVVRYGDEAISLLVDEIGDVLQVGADKFERRPDNLDPRMRDLISGVYKLNSRLLLVLDIAQAVAPAATANRAARELASV